MQTEDKVRPEGRILLRFTAKYDIIESRKGLKNQGLVSVLLSRNQSENRRQVNMVCIEDLVPENHILRDIDKAIERVFADAKEKHFMRYTHFRGLARLKMQVLLTFACMNLKKLAKWKKKNGLLMSDPLFILLLFGFGRKIRVTV